MGERPAPWERQGWPNAGARPKWQSNMAAVGAGGGFSTPAAVTRFPTVNRGLNRLAGWKEKMQRLVIRSRT